MNSIVTYFSMINVTGAPTASPVLLVQRIMRSSQQELEDSRNPRSASQSRTKSATKSNGFDTRYCLVSEFPFVSLNERRDTCSGIRKMSQTLSETTPKTFVVEHLDPELGPWSALEYGCIAKESNEAGARFVLTSVPESLRLPAELAALDSLHVEHRSVEQVFDRQKSRICLLDPAATSELSPEDGNAFDVFLFGGILDRTSELRKKGYTGRRLGPKQMTTDTAVRVTRMVVEGKSISKSLLQHTVRLQTAI
ncbi:hypothetical protein PRK78_001085 [Emydomyces testavorans]|uniref:Uncharacterized protein n=1 Tax=Emydomyces testavorans TaxID=2070801 RepID=A0AAF0DBV4_9EURO|nr:hypothetical protein PRK78_001085 [Emydomyces testavorans]